MTGRAPAGRRLPLFFRGAQSSGALRLLTTFLTPSTDGFSFSARSFSAREPTLPPRNTDVVV